MQKTKIKREITVVLVILLIFFSIYFLFLKTDFMKIEKSFASLNQKNIYDKEYDKFHKLFSMDFFKLGLLQEETEKLILNDFLNKKRVEFFIEEKKFNLKDNEIVDFLSENDFLDKKEDYFYFLYKNNLKSSEYENLVKIELIKRKILFSLYKQLNIEKTIYYKKINEDFLKEFIQEKKNIDFYTYLVTTIQKDTIKKEVPKDKIFNQFKFDPIKNVKIFLEDSDDLDKFENYNLYPHTQREVTLTSSKANRLKLNNEKTIKENKDSYEIYELKNIEQKSTYETLEDFIENNKKLVINIYKNDNNFEVIKNIKEDNKIIKELNKIQENIYENEIITKINDDFYYIYFDIQPINIDIENLNSLEDINIKDLTKIEKVFLDFYINEILQEFLLFLNRKYILEFNLK